MQGRTPLQVYRDFMLSFRDAFKAKPGGESYPATSSMRFFYGFRPSFFMFKGIV